MLSDVRTDYPELAGWEQEPWTAEDHALSFRIDRCIVQLEAALERREFEVAKVFAAQLAELEALFPERASE